MDHHYEEMVDFLSTAQAKAAWIFTYQQVAGGTAGLGAGLLVNTLLAGQGLTSALLVLGLLGCGILLMSAHLGVPIWRWLLYGSRYLVRRQRQQPCAVAVVAAGRRPARVIEVTDPQGRLLMRCWQAERDEA
jgi:hypothetical protein